jgi:hypothetical protein
MTEPAEIPVTRAELQAEAERIIERDGMPDDTTQLAELVIGYFAEMDKWLQLRPAVTLDELGSSATLYELLTGAVPPMPGRGAAHLPHQHATDYDADTCAICFPEDARPAVWANPPGRDAASRSAADAFEREAGFRPPAALSLADALKASLARAAARRGAADGQTT